MTSHSIAHHTRVVLPVSKLSRVSVPPWLRIPLVR